MKPNAPAWRARAGAGHWTENHVASVSRLASSANLPHDAGALGIQLEVDELTEVEAFYQFEDLRAATPEAQALARVRFAALRRRLLGDGRAA